MGNLAIVPARSGSKGLKDKNILPLNGKPLLSYSVEAAQQSGLFETVMVSTDSEDYAKVARNCGAEVPFLRSSHQSSDCASSWDTVREVLSMYRQIGKEFDCVTLLQPTSPLRTATDIQGAMALFRQKGADAVVSVTEVDHPVQWCFTLPENYSMDAFGHSEFHNARRQELPVYYRENGAIFIVRTEKIVDPAWDIYKQNCYAFPMPRSRSLDIDVWLDFQIAELLQKTPERESGG